MELRNTSGLAFVDVSSEDHRIYEFESGRTIRIEAPKWLHVAASGSHRLLDGSGVSHYIPSGWIWLRWTSRRDAPHFVK